MNHPHTRCGAVAIVGRPNVGKSTLLNKLLGQKISITSRKPQTTRYQILGIKTAPPDQIVYVDTPGLQERPGRALNRAMNREVVNALSGVDVVVFVTEALKWTGADDHVLDRLKAAGAPVILAINKVDTVKDKKRLLPFLERCATQMQFTEILPVSARNGDNLEALEQRIREHLPAQAWIFPEDQVTDRSERFLVAEIIREKLMRTLGQELPYATGVIIDQFIAKPRSVHITATIWVERPGQKRIVVGKGGAVLKKIGEQARHDIETMLDTRVFLETWVKVKENWADSAKLLGEMGLNASR